MKTTVLFFYLIIMILISPGCQNRKLPDPAEASDSPSDPLDDEAVLQSDTAFAEKPGLDSTTDIQVHRREAFTLAVAGSALVADQIYITLEAVHDSRCPVGVECFHAGWAEVIVVVAEEGQNAETIKLYHAADRDGKPSSVKVGRFTISVLDVIPYPVEVGIPLEDMRVTLLVE